MTALSWRSRIALAILSAVLCAVGAPPRDWWLAGLLAWLPLVVSLAGTSPARAATLGWLQGTVSHAIALGWPVFSALRHVASLGVLPATALTCILVLFQGGRSAIIGLLFGLAQGRRTDQRLLWVFPLALVTAELLYPMLFPWQTALLVHAAPALLQVADLGGPLLISFIVATADTAIAVAWLGRQGGRQWVMRRLGLALALVVITAFYGWCRISHFETRAPGASPVRIGIVQGNLAPSSIEHRNPLAIYRDESLALLRRQGPFDLLLWPETALRSPIREAELGGYLARTAFADPRGDADQPRLRVPLLTGVVVLAKDNAHLFNSAAMVAPSGRILGRYDKQHLVPIGETLPFEDRWPGLRRLFPAARTFEKGPAFTPVEWEGHRLAVTICYEDILGGYVSAQIHGAPAAELLVNLTSDAWFGRSGVSTLHSALSEMRAIEHRRYLVRATNDGVTAVVDPAGRVLRQLPTGQVASEVFSVWWMSGCTVYDVVGDVPWVVVVGALVMLLVLARWRRLLPSVRRSR